MRAFEHAEAAGDLLNAAFPANKDEQELMTTSGSAVLVAAAHVHVELAKLGFAVEQSYDGQNISTHWLRMFGLE
jgi:hypothetical protein